MKSDLHVRNRIEHILTFENITFEHRKFIAELSELDGEAILSASDIMRIGIPTDVFKTVWERLSEPTVHIHRLIDIVLDSIVATGKTRSSAMSGVQYEMLQGYVLRIRITRDEEPTKVTEREVTIADTFDSIVKLYVAGKIAPGLSYDDLVQRALDD